MESTTKVSLSMTKKQIIEEYNRLLDAFKKEAEARREYDGRLTELEKKKDREALDAGLRTTVDSVLEGVGGLRVLVGSTLTDLSDKMAEQAKKLEKLNRAVELQEARLKDLHEIEYAADTMSKLAASYAEEMVRIESEHASRIGDLEEGYSKKTEELERAFNDRKAQLKREIEEKQALWESDEGEISKKREREQEEYEYNRDRSRRLEEDEYAEKRAALEKGLRSLREEAEREIAERKVAIQAKEEEFQRLADEVEGFPERLEAAVKKAQEEAAAELRKEMEHKASLADVEREWERKSLEQTISHLQGINESLEKKIAGLTAELVEARKQVNVIAEKAIEGTSIAKAFESVNRIALKQARTSEKSLED